MKRIVIVGATSTIAENCARHWVKDSVELLLLGRNLEKLEHIARDLEIRSPNSKISFNTIDFENPQVIQASVSEICRSSVDIVLIAHGSLPDQHECQNDLELLKKTIEINGVSVVMFAEAFAKFMELQNRGSLAIISSVAGERGRKSNYVYGSAKGLVTRYCQGLQHRLARTNVNVVLIKPGPTDTPMTIAMKTKGIKMASPMAVANSIVKGVADGKRVVYAPGKWRVIMMIIRHLPSAVFNRLEI